MLSRPTASLQSAAMNSEKLEKSSTRAYADFDIVTNLERVTSNNSEKYVKLPAVMIDKNLINYLRYNPKHNIGTWYIRDNTGIIKVR